MNMNGENIKNHELSPKWKRAEQAFDNEAEAVRFVHDFWQFVLPPDDSSLQKILEK